MKKFFLLLCAALLVLGSALPLVSYRLTRAVLAPEMPAASEDAVPSVPPAASARRKHPPPILRPSGSRTAPPGRWWSCPAGITSSARSPPRCR